MVNNTIVRITLLLIKEKVINTAITKTVIKNTRVLCLIFSLFFLSACVSTEKKPKNLHENDGVDVFELVGKADRAYKEGRWLEAEQAYRKITEKVPQDYYAWFRLANTQLRQGQINSAINLYNEARKRNPEQSKPYYNVSTAYIFLALDALREADQRLRGNDPGKMIIAERIRILAKLIDQPVDNHVSPSDNVQVQLEESE